MPLPAIQLDDCKDLFSGVSDKVKANPSFQCALSDCGGHARTLSYLSEVVSSLREEQITYQNLTSRMLEMILINTSRLHLSMDIITPVLLGTLVPLQQNIGGQTTQDLISSGVYINSCDSNSLEASIIPQMSSYQLQAWAKEVEKGGSKEHSVEIQIAQLITDYIFTGIPWPPGAEAGNAMEKFHFGWEAIVGTLKGQNQCFRKLGQHYCGAIAKNETLLATTVQYPMGICEAKRADERWKREDYKKYKISDIVQPALGNPGYLHTFHIFFFLFFFF